VLVGPCKKSCLVWMGRSLIASLATDPMQERSPVRLFPSIPPPVNASKEAFRSSLRLGKIIPIPRSNQSTNDF
jgi:hypothetical protein